MTASAIRDFTCLTRAPDGAVGCFVRIEARRFVGKTKKLQKRAFGLHHPRKRQWRDANSLSLRAQLTQLTREPELTISATSMPVTRVDEYKSLPVCLLQTGQGASTTAWTWDAMTCGGTKRSTKAAL